MKPFDKDIVAGGFEFPDRWPAASLFRRQDRIDPRVALKELTERLGGVARRRLGRRLSIRQIDLREPD